MRSALLSLGLAQPALRGSRFFSLSLPRTGIEKGTVAVTPLDARVNVAPVATPHMPPSDSIDMPAVFGHVHEQVQDVNWPKFGMDTFNHAKQCLPHCVKYVLPKHEGKNLFHVAGKVGHCLLWECLPQAFRNAGKPGPFVADAMDVLQAQMTANRKQKEEQRRVEEEAMRLKAINQIEEAELAHLEVELDRAEHSEHLAWAVAAICAVGAAGVAVFAVQRKDAPAALLAERLPPGSARKNSGANPLALALPAESLALAPA